jgi:hypothetical protein
VADENPIATEVIYEDTEGPQDVVFHDGSGGELGEGLTLRTKRGDALLVPKGHIETARNDGAEYRAILIELLKD